MGQLEVAKRLDRADWHALIGTGQKSRGYTERYGLISSR
jgi:hypothetical protein